MTSSLSIANKVVKNRKLSEGLQHPNSSDLKLTQSCGASRCMMCPLLFRLDEDIVINGQKLFLDRNLNCKDKNIIYVAQCKICALFKQDNVLAFYEDSYFGQTVTEAHTRFNGHRNKFVINDERTYEKSALSQHCYNCHMDNMNLNNFNIGIVKVCKAMDLDREENRYISKFRTDIWGLNRIKVVR